jgi:hypothetical protein
MTKIAELLNKKVIVEIDPQFSASDWQLYEGQEQAAATLNLMLKSMVNVEGPLPPMAEVHSKMLEIMRILAESGADDTEPRMFLMDVLDSIYTLPIST